MRQATHNGYHIASWSDVVRPIDELWTRFPDLVMGKYLVNTSYDSGSLTLSDSERADGWRMVGRLGHSPKIRNIPHDQFDEWLVFDHSIEVPDIETMVNYCTFSPIDFDSDETQLFWRQILALKPLHVLGENYGTYLVTRETILFERIVAADCNDGRSGL